MRTTASVSNLKARLSSYLGRVKAGEEVLVVERGRLVARISPIGDATPSSESLRELERQGLVRVGTGRLPKAFWKVKRPRDASAAIRKAVAEERESGW